MDAYNYAVSLGVAEAEAGRFISDNPGAFLGERR
jgi:hypothetical protein